MDLSLEEMIQSQVNKISTSEQLKDFIEQHSHDIPAFCQALESQIDHAKIGQREALMALILYYFGQTQYLERIAQLIAKGHLSGFVMEICEPVEIDGQRLISLQLMQDLVLFAHPDSLHMTEQQQPTSVDYFLLNHAFDQIKPYIAHFRQSNDYRLARRVIEAYEIHNCDEGTLDIIEQYYMRTGKSGFSDILSHWATYRYEKPVQGYARQSQEDNGHHQKVAQVAFNILNHAFRFTDWMANFLIVKEGSLNDPPNRVSVNRLLSAMAVRPPQGAVDLVYDMLSCPELHTKYRMEALLYYVDFTGKIPEQRKELIDAYFSSDPTKGWSNGTLDDSKAYDLLNLTQRNLVTLEELLIAARTNRRGYQTLQAICGWSNKQDYRDLIVTEMILALENVIKVFLTMKSGWIYREPLQGVITTLSGFELAASEKEAIDTLLQQAITHFQTYFVDSPYLVADMNHCRVKLGLLTEIKDFSEMNPWDAMAIHWQQQQITWDRAARVLVDARVIPDLSYFEKFESSDLVDNIMSSSNQFYSLLAGQGQHKDCFCMLDSDSDDGFSYETFDELVGLLHQPEVMIRQIPEGEKLQYLYTDLSDITESENDDQETYHFECQQQHYKFRLSYQAAFEQIKVLVRTFNNLLQQLGRVERCYELNMDGADYYQMFFVADRFKYPEMQQYLRLPSWKVV